MKRALVLCGGGSRGAYEVGAYQALVEAGYTFDIIVGTSIGALNGALIVQDTYFRGMRLWRTTNFYKLFGPELLEMKDLKKAIKEKVDIQDTSSLFDTLDEILKEAVEGKGYKVL